MPVTFKKQDIPRVTITKASEKPPDAEFYFETRPSIVRKARTNSFFSGDISVGTLYDEIFRMSLVGWKHVIDEKGKEIPFSLGVRDFIIDMTDDDGAPLFTSDDYERVLNGGPTNAELLELKKNEMKQAKQSKRKPSTSKKR